MARLGETLIVNARDPEEMRVALLHEGRLSELRGGNPVVDSLVGNIYLGVVKQVEVGLDAVFVDIGQRRAGFLHVGNVHPAYADPALTPFEAATQAFESRESDDSDPSEAGQEGEPDPADAEAAADEKGAVDSSDERARPEIQDLLREGQTVVVQVLRDAVRGKGATLSTMLSIAGSCLVWMPTLGRIGLSRRIAEEAERDRLKEALTECGAGPELPVIARTAAADQNRRVLRAELRRLSTDVEKLRAAADTYEAPALLKAEDGVVMRGVRELFHGGVQRILCDDEEQYRVLSDWLERKGALAHLQLEMHDDFLPLFEKFGVESDYQRLFRARVPIGSGASIVISQTEALTAIDVNSGRIDGDSLEQTALACNLLAAEAVADQVRLRDLGGILVVDFIDMREAQHRRQVENALREALQRDRARMKVGRIGSFGLLSFTRRRIGTGPPRAYDQPCRHCAGAGHLAHHASGALRVLRRLRALEGAWKVRVRAHPGLLHQLQRHQEALKALPHRIEMVEDSQVSSGEPVLEPRTPLAEGEGAQ